MFFFSSRRRHTRSLRDWSSDVCSSDICLVTPFAWSQPHDVNEHVAGVAAELRALGHTVTVLAPSGRARDLIAGRKALLDGADMELIAVAPVLPVSRASS